MFHEVNVVAGKKGTKLCTLLICNYENKIFSLGLGRLWETWELGEGGEESWIFLSCFVHTMIVE